MPQYRKLNTNILLSPDVDAMPDDFTRLAWTWLPLICTRDGTGQMHTTLIKSQLFPMRRDVTEEMIEQAFAYFAQAGLITIYEVAGRQYFYVCNFAKYQGVTTKESPSPYPPPPKENEQNNVTPTPDLLQSKSRVTLPSMNIESESESINNEPFRELFDTFLDATGMVETLINVQRAAQEISDKWLPSNVTPEEVRHAVKELAGKNYKIAGPQSLTNTINMIRSKSKAPEPKQRQYSEVFQ